MREISRRKVPWLLLLVLTTALWVAGPLHLPVGYHDFADHRLWFGIPNAADVFSNLGFLLAGQWGLAAVARLPGTPARLWWRVFALAVIAVCVCSAWYHIAPGDERLVWDRLPIALASAAILAAVLCERVVTSPARAYVYGVLLALAAIASVLAIPLLDGDLRPYLLLQLAVLVVIPALCWSERAPRVEFQGFFAASLLYLLAKLAEVADVRILEATGWLSGHSLKHWLSALACAMVVAVISRRTRPARVRIRRTAAISLGILMCGCAAVVLKHQTPFLL